MAKRKIMPLARRERARANAYHRVNARLLTPTGDEITAADLEGFVRETIVRLEITKRSLWKLVASTKNARQRIRALEELLELNYTLASAYEYYESIRRPTETRDETVARLRQAIAAMVEETERPSPPPDDSTQ